MKKLYLLIAFLAVVAALLFYTWWQASPEVDKVKMQSAKIADIRKMAELCTVDFYEDLPIKASIGPRHIFAKTTVTFSISFDLEKIDMQERNDTLFIKLPQEKIEILESTAPGSYLVYDTWSDNFLGKTNFTTAEENRIKAKVIDNFSKTVRNRGYVKEARAEARRNLADMLHTLTGNPVVVN